MDQGNVRIKLRMNGNEIEIEAPVATMKETISFIPEMLEKMPKTPEASSDKRQPANVYVNKTIGESSAKEVISSIPQRSVNSPEIKVERGDSLIDVITKTFRDPWGRQPRKLNEVREVLESYGLIYPKQSVAVALLRLAQSGTLRRFKGEGGDFVYTASTALSNSTTQPLEEAISSIKTVPEVR